MHIDIQTLSQPFKHKTFFMTLRIYVLFFLLVYLGLAFVLSSLRVYRQTGINPVTFGGTDSAHDYAGFLFKLTAGLLLAVVASLAFFPSVSRYLLPVWYLETPTARYAGLVLIHLSLIWTLMAQAQMGNAWRIGIDPNHLTTLATHGLFGLSRNPVFLGMLLALLGLFLVLPNAVTLLVLALGYVLMGIQIRLEEEHLQHLHGQAYRQYQRKVRRWL